MRNLCLLLLQSLFLDWAVGVLTDDALPFGDINLLVVTDVHSWIGGHKKNEPELDVDYGDVVSFHERLKEYCQETNKDYFFVMNGDYVDGTG